MPSSTSHAWCRTFRTWAARHHPRVIERWAEVRPKLEAAAARSAGCRFAA